jgi:hypothetical protein
MFGILVACENRFKILFKCDLSRLEEIESLEPASVAVEVADGMLFDEGIGGEQSAPSECGEKFGKFFWLNAKLRIRLPRVRVPNSASLVLWKIDCLSPK